MAFTVNGRGCKSLILLTVFVLNTVSAKIVTGHLKTEKNWAFLTRFCFFPHNGTFIYNFTYSTEFATQKLLVYFDEASQWDAAYKKAGTCKQKEDVLKRRRGQVIRLDESDKTSGCIRVNDTSGSPKFINCIGGREIVSQRVRWWYLALSNCHSSQGLSLDSYSVVFENRNRSEKFIHLSADEYYIVHTDITFITLYLLLALFCCIQSYLLYSRRLLHVTYKLYLASLIIQIMGISLLTFYYHEFAIQGIVSEHIKVTGKAACALSSIIFILLLLLLSKGYTITRARLRFASVAKIAGFIGTYLIIYALLFFFEQMYFDPGEVLYTYESGFGFGLIGLRMVGLIAFTYYIYRTVRLYPAKKGFFIVLYILFSMWFASLPLVIIMATGYIPPYMREQVVNGFEIGLAFRSHFFFMLITWPNRFNQIFPFHVRTNQILAMAKSEVAGGDTLDKFTHYQYAPNRPETAATQIRRTQPRITVQLVEISEFTQTDNTKGKNLPSVDS